MFLFFATFLRRSKGNAREQNVNTSLLRNRIVCTSEKLSLGDFDTSRVFLPLHLSDVLIQILLLILYYLLQNSFKI